MIQGLRYVVLDDPDRHARLRVMFPTPRRQDPWGVLAPLRGTPWGEQIPVVTGEALSHALHGHPKMLREMWGNPPRTRAMRLEQKHRMCHEHQFKICGIATPECHPGSAQMPDCYVAPFHDLERRRLADVVARAWAEDRHVFVVEGPEFVVT